MQQTIHVTIYDQSGHAFTYKIVASSFQKAVQSAAVWFKRKAGSPTPTKDTVYEVSMPGDSRKWRVCGGTVQAVR